MKRFVLDCSVSGAWCLKDEASEEADRYLEMLQGGQALVPPLWVAEMANVLLVAEKRRRIASDDVTLAFRLLRQLPIVVDVQESRSMPEIHQLARDHRLSAYDACYLELALRQRLPLASLDQGLRKAARPAKVPLV